jgi:hypothetical protein
MSYKSKDKIHYDSATGSTFKEAFADARKEGKKTFEWDGKKYGTKLKGEGESKQSKDYLKDAINRAPKKDTDYLKDAIDRAPKQDNKEEKKEDKKSRGTAASLAGAGLGLGAMAILSGLRGAERARAERELNKGKEYKAPPRIKDLGPGEATWEGEGGRYYKKGGKVKKFAAGGAVPASKPAPKKDNTPIPEWLQNERKNQEQDMRNRREREAYDKGEKTRLKDQGGLKKGGMASSRGDGIAQRGKTKGRMC